MSSDPVTLLGLPVSFIVQGIIGALIFFWAYGEARKTYKATEAALKPNPIVAGVSMAWDRDMQERFLQLIERLVKAQENQADIQSHMSGSWKSMADQQQQEMDERIKSLMKALESVDAQVRKKGADDPLFGMIMQAVEKSGRRPRPRVPRKQ